MTNKYQSIRLFQNPFLEKLTHVHPLIPLVMWTPVIGHYLHLSVEENGLGPWELLVTAVLGLFSWTLVEYTLHRFVFHFAAKSSWSKKLVYLSHGIHHDDPDDPTRLVMPPVPAIFYATLFYHLFFWTLGRAWGQGTFAFFLIGYLCYDYIHYSVHHFVPKTRWGKYLRRNHLVHHARHKTYYGVTGPLWDYVFKTL